MRRSVKLLLLFSREIVPACQEKVDLPPSVCVGVLFIFGSCVCTCHLTRVTGCKSESSKECELSAKHTKHIFPLSNVFDSGVKSHLHAAWFSADDNNALSALNWSKNWLNCWDYTMSVDRTSCLSSLIRRSWSPSDEATTDFFSSWVLANVEALFSLLSIPLICLSMVFCVLDHTIKQFLIFMIFFFAPFREVP